MVCDVSSNPAIATYYVIISTPNRSVSKHGGLDKPYPTCIQLVDCVGLFELENLSSCTSGQAGFDGVEERSTFASE